MAQPSARTALITVLSVPDCPNASLLVGRLREALPELAQPVSVVVVRDDAEAVAWAMSGSPTLLVDGVDPFAAEGAQPSLSCRLYPAPDGQLSGAPSVEQLRAAVGARTGERSESSS